MYTNVPSARVNGLLGELVVSVSLHISQDEEQSRTRSMMEAKKEEVANWLDVMFWSLRWFIQTGRDLPSNDVLAMVMIKQRASFASEENETIVEQRAASPTPEDIELAQKLVQVVRLSVEEEQNTET